MTKETKTISKDELHNMMSALTRITMLLKNKYPNDQEFGNRVRYLYSEECDLEKMIKKEGFAEQLIYESIPTNYEC